MHWYWYGYGTCMDMVGVVILCRDALATAYAPQRTLHGAPHAAVSVRWVLADRIAQCLSDIAAFRSLAYPPFSPAGLTRSVFLKTLGPARLATPVFLKGGRV